MPKVIFKGGPCDGRTADISQSDFNAGSTTCQGQRYTYNGATDPGNKLPIFQYEPGNPPAPGGGGAIKAPRAHSGWQDLRHSINKTMPGALHASQRNTAAALRSVSRARKVRL